MMNKILFIFLFLFNTPSTTPANTHPIKLTSSEIKYDTKTKSIRVECKVFIDDFAPVISASLLTSINNSNLTQDDLRRIESYFMTTYKISINDAVLPWKIDAYKISKRENVLSLVFLSKNIKIKKGDDLKIENELLFEVFGDIQSNWMTIRFPPFLRNYNFESKIENPLYSYIF